MEKIDIIYEDGQIIALSKPVGMVTTKEGGDVDTVEDWLVANFAWAKILARGGIIHRLDKGTSGLLLVAKTQKSLDFFKKQFKNRLVYKEYVALVEGEVSFEGEIKAPVGRSKYGFSKWAVCENGKEAWTKFERLKVYKKGEKKYSLVKIILKTGRTHQIRVHFSYLGWPLVGDSLYGGKTEILSRPFLHSKIIKLVDPTGKEFILEAGISSDLVLALEKL